MQAERGARGGRGRRPGRERPGGDRHSERAGAAAAVARGGGGGGDGGGRRGRGRGFRGGRGGGAPRGGRRDRGGRGAGASAPDSFSQFRFAEEKEWDGEASCPKQNSAFYVDSESLVRALQELPLSLRLNVAAELVQATVPLELPQVKPKRSDDGKGLGMQLKGPISELKSAGCPESLGKDSLRLGPARGSQKPASLVQSAADHLEEELDLLLNLDVPIKEGDNILPDQNSQDPKSEKDGEVAQEEKVAAKPSVTEEKNVEPEQPSTSKNVTEEELEDWLDSMIS
uniref:Apoptosis and caspase activation inhibitor n=1 Tax=Propithecus coquereli TaxID=379532 RepID=A0A2K6FPT4_PROCO